MYVSGNNIECDNQHTTLLSLQKPRERWNMSIGIYTLKRRLWSYVTAKHKQSINMGSRVVKRALYKMMDLFQLANTALINYLLLTTYKMQSLLI